MAILLVCGCDDGVMTGGSGGATGAGGSGGGPAVDAAPMMELDAASNLPTCSCWLGDGSYCATGVANHASANGCQVATLSGHEGDVLGCAGGVWTVQNVCPAGCYVAPDGTPDGCAPTGVPTYHLPWACGVTYATTQGNNGDICSGNGGDHTGIQQYAFDFGLPRHTPILAARGGTVAVAANVVGPGQMCYDGCTQPFGSSEFWQCCNTCLNTSNHVNVDHGDTSVATYWHMDEVTVQDGQMVRAGDVLGYSGTSGCSSGPHLHFMVMGNCPTGYCQSIQVQFQEAGIPACGNDVRSQNCP